MARADRDALGPGQTAKGPGPVASYMAPERGDRTVTCVACGTELPRTDAREYDKYGDRWDREGKCFEYFCKPCFRDLVKQPRVGLETQLEDAGAGKVPDSIFFELFFAQNEDLENEPE
jgi:hypothetical protein